MVPVKNLVVAGCSFTNDDHEYSWATYLRDNLRNQWGKLQYKNHGTVSAGNGYISRVILYELIQTLKTWRSDELLVGIMWSGFNRYEIFNKDPSLLNYNTVGIKNPVGFIKENWILLNHHWDDEFSINYYKNFYDQVGLHISTLEHILRTQWFLEKHNIRYFMSSFAPLTFPEKTFLDDPNLKYLYDMIDWNNFLPVKSCMEWCVEESNLPGRNDAMLHLSAKHPSKEQHEAFTKRVIIPHLKNKGLIDE